MSGGISTNMLGRRGTIRQDAAVVHEIKGVKGEVVAVYYNGFHRCLYVTLDTDMGLIDARSEWVLLTVRD